MSAVMPVSPNSPTRVTLPYGETYVKDSIVDLSLTTTKQQITVFTTAGEASDVTVAAGEDELVVVKDGRYFVIISISASNQQVGQVHTIKIDGWKNNAGTILPNIHSHRSFQGDSDVGAISISGIVNLVEGDALELWADTDRELGADVRFEDITMSIFRVGV